jgi:hypothetical protein
MRLAVTLILVAFVVPRCWACGSYLDDERRERLALAREALSQDHAQADQAISALRAQGQAGLDAMMAMYGEAITRHRANPTQADETWDRLSAALDKVAAQKDAWAAGLYWYTDMGAAQREAGRTGKPILSLRLLGTLDTEFSCANSRFFRTVLYPNATVGKALRDGYVLHWQSHRPVPHLTIDFGDGRKIERTITGNSVHYVLTPDGRVVDAIPGLYGPAAFLRALNAAGSVARPHDRPGFDQLVNEFHAAAAQSSAAALENDRRRLALLPAGPGGRPVVRPTAANATRLAASKSAVEMRPVAAVAPDRAALAAEGAVADDDALWTRIATLHADDARLDDGSRAVIRGKLGGAAAANRLTATKAFVEDPIVRIVGRFERSVAEDTVRNEYLLHQRVHQWFITGQAPADLSALNEKVYSELFLMPATDPWLGLVPADAYTALPADPVSPRR